MRKIVVALSVALLASCFAACSDDDAAVVPVASSSAAATSFSPGTGSFSVPLGTYSLTAGASTVSYQFRSGGLLNMTAGGVTTTDIAYTYNTSTGDLSFNWSVGGSTMSYTYKNCFTTASAGSTYLVMPGFKKTSGTATSIIGTYEYGMTINTMGTVTDTTIILSYNANGTYSVTTRVTGQADQITTGVWDTVNHSVVGYSFVSVGGSLYMFAPASAYLFGGSSGSTSSANSGASSSSGGSSASVNSASSASAASSTPTLESVSYRETVTVPGGTFSQVPTSGNTFSHTITSFKMGKYEVTYELWYTVYQWAIGNGYQFANAGREGHNGTAGAVPTTAKYEPVTSINWRNAIVWCNAYSQMEGKTPVYCSDSGFSTPIKDSRDGSYDNSNDGTAGSFDNPYVNWNATGYRLPTEGEWQYAASYKDGSSWTPYNYASGATAAYTDTTATGLVAWYDGNSGYVTKTVGTKGANALGIHDMSGNVWEWCQDWWGTLPTTAQTNYRGPAFGSARIHRGESYGSSAVYLRVGTRSSSYPYDEYDSYGFRIAARQ